MDSWNDNQIALISLGGNKKLNELLSLYNINKKKVSVNIYKTKILEFYRKLLKCELNDEKRPNPVSKADSLKSFERGMDINVQNKEKSLEEMLPGKIDISNTLGNMNYNDPNASNNSSQNSSNYSNPGNNSDRFGSGKTKRLIIIL
jgi:hypothetical protein